VWWICRTELLPATYEGRTRPAELLQRVSRGLLQIRTADSELVTVPEKAVTVACRNEKPGWYLKRRSPGCQ